MRWKAFAQQMFLPVLSLAILIQFLAFLVQSAMPSMHPWEILVRFNLHDEALPELFLVTLAVLYMIWETGKKLNAYAREKRI